MSLMRPMDPAFPIDRQIALDASAIVLINLFTLDKADEQAFLEAWQADAAFMKRQPGFISTQPPGYRRKSCLSQLCRLGIDRRLQGGILASRVQGKALLLPVLGRCLPAPLPEGRRAGHLRRLGSPFPESGHMDLRGPVPRLRARRSH